MSEADIAIREKLQYQTAQITLFNLTGKCSIANGSRYYYPEALKELNSRALIINGKRILIAEQYNKSILGIIEGSGFCDELANTLWIDDMLIRLEEERIGNEIHDLEETLEEESEEAVSMEEEAEDIERKLSNEIIEEELLDKNKNLGFMEYDGEIFIPQKLSDGGWYIIHSLKERVTRTKYDKDYKVIQREKWSIPSAENSKLESTEYLEYFEDTYKIKKRTIDYDELETSAIYDERGLVVESTEYKKQDEKKYILKRSKRSYDEKERLLLDETTEYTYSQDFKRLNYRFTKKYVYTYKEVEDIPADFEYFENDVIKMKNIYSDVKGNYSSQIYFEDGFSVKTLYEDDLRSKDIYYLNNEVTRIKEYEK